MEFFKEIFFSYNLFQGSKTWRFRGADDEVIILLGFGTMLTRQEKQNFRRYKLSPSSWTPTKILAVTGQNKIWMC
jgi:hypothetical protein